MYKVYVKSKNEINIKNNIESDYTDKSLKEISKKAWTYLFDILKNDYNIEISKKDIIYNNNKKPYKKENKKYFNISHSRNMIAIVISDLECGVDIEYIDYTKDISKLLNKVLSQKELEMYNISKIKQEFFYEIWTKKEAYYKMLGTGLVYNNLNKDINNNCLKSYILEDKSDKYYISIAQDNVNNEKL